MFISVSNGVVRQKGTNWFLKFFGSEWISQALGPEDAWQHKEPKDFLYKRCRTALAMVIPTLPFAEHRCSLNKLDSFIFTYVRFATQFEQ